MSRGVLDAVRSPGSTRVRLVLCWPPRLSPPQADVASAEPGAIPSSWRTRMVPRRDGRCSSVSTPTSSIPRAFSAWRIGDRSSDTSASLRRRKRFLVEGTICPLSHRLTAPVTYLPRTSFVNLTWPIRRRRRIDRIAHVNGVSLMPEVWGRSIQYEFRTLHNVCQAITVKMSLRISGQRSA